MKCIFWIFVILEIFSFIRTTNIDGQSTGTTIPVSTNSVSQSIAISSLDSSTASFNQTTPAPTTDSINPLEHCPSNVQCSQLGGDCIQCSFNTSCFYGSVQEAECSPKPQVNCTGNQVFRRQFECRFCYQLPEVKYQCNHSTTCMISNSKNYYPPRSTYISLCTAQQDVLCLGRRRFYKERECNWTSGYKWSTAFILSITVGGFGVDRFYLGLWREAIGKLFSFGGLGVWTLVDVILIGVGYVGPADGSLYI
ncbi:hypothetical protein LOTGIDRAFT_215567 [Lottia gigantea]|uniref:TM2 domain-containing protein n=1 Tax=Lottia gigantea TaxID=225164 RepID=V4ALV5_LOTGI|nr:hypothetical protein LOTGIDRAFT_215567 [Lottia gigantea]ESO94576.1 hypothetical protein LOTGIDRAFT_215567 [Lottia gigantea]